MTDDTELLGTFNAELVINTDRYSVVGNVFASFQAKNKIIVSLKVSNDLALPFRCVSDEPIELRIPGKEPVRVLLLKLKDSPCGDSVEIELLPKPQQIKTDISNETLLTRVDGSLLNFHSFYSKKSGENYSVETRAGFCNYGATYLEFEDWRIMIEEFPATRVAVKNLGILGGYARTHKVTICKHGYKSFSVGEFEFINDRLRLFLSFANGAWTSLWSYTGYNEDRLVYEMWSAPLVDSWESRLGWFDRHNAQILNLIFDGFCKISTLENYQDAIEKALYWYLRSNRSSSGIDGGIILSHSALERLSHLVINLNQLQLTSKKPSTAEKIRLAALHLDIPVEVKQVDDCPIYAGVTVGLWYDYPDAINKFRNNLVHPKANEQLTALKCTTEIWQSAQWLIELFILRLSGYSGVYSNRTRKNKWLGEVESLPWSLPNEG